MLRIVVCCLFITIGLKSEAVEPTENAPAYEHLLEVNAQWVNYKASAPNLVLSFQDENERIRFHLQNVIHTLRKSNMPAIKSSLLNRLWSYVEEQEFPINLGHKERNPYFIDHKGTYCAVGFLMKESGRDGLAQQIRQEHNYDYIKDIHTDGIPEWAEEFGFTPSELAWIQPGYTVETVFSPVPGRLNGPVKAIRGNW